VNRNEALLLVFICCLAFVAYAEEQAPSTADRVKSDVKGAARGVAKAAKDVGKQIGTGTKNAVKSIKTKVKADVNQGTPGDGSAKRQNERWTPQKRQEVSFRHAGRSFRVAKLAINPWQLRPDFVFPCQ